MNEIKLMEGFKEMEALSSALGPGIVDVINVTVIVLSIIFHILASAGLYKMLKKAGVEKNCWLAFLPIFREYMMYKTWWKANIFWPAFVCSFVNEIIDDSIHIPLKILGLAAAIGYYALSILMFARTAESFGKGKGWSLLLLFFPYVAMPILGFGNAEYKSGAAE